MGSYTCPVGGRQQAVGNRQEGLNEGNLVGPAIEVPINMEHRFQGLAPHPCPRASVAQTEKLRRWQFLGNEIMNGVFPALAVVGEH